ncbi:hypothetical protein PI124_g20394 [Phytophthora idaei]|nr:hypothetical protein PI125_g21223 [Phytophthora idaei]KAG3132185.1 hypothetical protein PI126_g19742 [Phytophthora idaei]KAG3234553.1 hypothetical protein PI124_g20394 [Phytophthora idaei]
MAAARPANEDCLGCRLTGSATLLGVGAYFLNERSKLPHHDLGQRRWLLACAGSFVAAGVWRATTHLFETQAATAAAKASPTSRLDAQPWYACEGCSQKARAWFGIGGKHKQEQRRTDDK